MQQLKKIPFFLLLLPLFLCLHGALENHGFIKAGELLLPGLSILTAVLVLTGIIFLVTKNFQLATLISFFISLWYLFFGALHDFIKSHAVLSFLKSYSVLLPVLIVITVLWIFFLLRKKNLHPKLISYLNVLLLIYCCVDAYQLINKTVFVSQKTTVKQPAFFPNKVTQKPNVYLIVLDEYPGFRSLTDSFGFSNATFEEYLRANNFRVGDGIANYDLTYFSMSSILNMQYIQKDYEALQLTQSDFQRRGVEINNAAVPQIFKSLGYSIENYSIFDLADQPAVSSNNAFVLAHTKLLTDKILHNRIKRDIGDRLGKFIPFWKSDNFYRHDIDNKYTEKMLLQSAYTKTSTPKFVYGHFMLPHGPYYYDSAGNKNNFNQISDYTTWSNKALFISYLKYANTRVMHIVNNIIKNDPLAIIIVMGDHGYRQYGDGRLYQPFRYNNLLATRVPGKKPFVYSDSSSNVNWFRYIFNSQFGQNMPYLADTSIVLRH